MNQMVPAEAMSAAAIVERVVVAGDLAKLSPDERVAYYVRTCESLGLNPLTRPFEYVILDGRLTLYARKDATDQIRRNAGISVDRLEYPTPPDGYYIVIAYGHDRLGRTDTASGIVSVTGLSGNAFANALMKAETKAKRRLTLSLAGLGFPDESELSSIPTAEEVEVDDQGHIHQPTLADKVAARAAKLAAVTEPTPEPEVVLDRDAEEEAVNEVPRLTLAEFMERAGKIDREVLRLKAREMFPGVKTAADLTEVQLAALWAALALVEPEVVIEEVAILEEPMPEEASLVTPATCGDKSPFSSSRCILAIEHKGPHKADDNETW